MSSWWCECSSGCYLLAGRDESGHLAESSASTVHRYIRFPTADRERRVRGSEWSPQRNLGAVGEDIVQVGVGGRRVGAVMPEQEPIGVGDECRG